MRTHVPAPNPGVSFSLLSRRYTVLYQRVVLSFLVKLTNACGVLHVTMPVTRYTPTEGRINLFATFWHGPVLFRDCVTWAS